MLPSAGQYDNDIFDSINDDELAAVDLNAVITSATQTSASPMPNNPSCQPILQEEADAYAATADKIQ